jgi:micrococcal nuclease|tara:strand:- start:52 stop:390 length:339 start_codon:yes stop_codon:yes gene_type:complete
MYKYNAKLDRVVDGDTVDALVDLGFNTWKKVRIRMHGMNAPESRTRDLDEKARGIASKIRLEEILESGQFTLQSMGVGKFGRCLGILYVDGSNVNQMLITEGHATEYYGGKR